MADCLLAAGHTVSVFDVSSEAMAPRVAKGARAATSAADAVTGATFVSIVVFNDSQLVDVATGPDGVLRSLDPDAVVAIHTTASLTTILRVAQEAHESGVSVIDAGVSGGEEGATNGTLLTMVGGSEDAVVRARPALMAFSKEVVHAGPIGAGMALKLARNAAGYIMMSAVHEAMVLARAANVDLALLNHVIQETGVLAQALAPLVLGGPSPLTPEDPESLRTMLDHLRDLGEKDLQQALALAADLEVEIPVTNLVSTTFHAVARL
jgi:3-hydroxyisobutyrate dehydrogenase-like beta-hydroxyacid dehydrogenase